MSEEQPCIKVKASTKSILDKIGSKTDTYNSIIERLLKNGGFLK